METETLQKIDLNCDMGELHPITGLNFDEEIMPYISSCNVCCGLHSGSLLLSVMTEEPYYNKIGLYSFKNCILCDILNINDTINYITDPQNRQEIDKIRKNGYIFAKENLNSTLKYEEFNFFA